MRVNGFGRQDAVRILHLDARELERWERAGLIAPQEQYSFTELGDLRTLRDLRGAADLRKADPGGTRCD